MSKHINFFLLLTLLLIYLMAARTPMDTDLWWHLRAGEETIRSGAPLIEDIFSFTRYQENWNNHSWLSQVLLFESFHLFGYPGLTILMAFLAVLSMWIVSIQMPVSPLVKAFLLVFGSFVASVNWVPRPQIFSLVFLALTGFILQKYLAKPGKWIWMLPLLFMLWGNLHGGYPLGLILIGCIVAGEILEFFLGSSPHLTRQEIIRLILAAAASYLLTALNPNGLNTLLIPFQTVGVEGLQNLVSEWASPDFHDPIQQIFLLFFLCLVWLMVLGKKPARFSDLVSLSIFSFLAFTARRNFGPFVIVLLPAMAYSLSSLVVNKFGAGKLQINHLSGQKRQISANIQKTVNFSLITLLVITAGLKTFAVTQPQMMEGFIRQYYPLNAVEWLEENRTPTRLMNEYNWGGFLIWSLAEYPVFIDGRTDLFGDEVINQWLEVIQCGPNWVQTMAQWDVHLMLLEKSRPVVGCAVQHGWSIVYEDDLAVILEENAFSALLLVQ